MKNLFRSALLRPLLLLSVLLLALLGLGVAPAFAGGAPCPDLDECPCVMELTENLVNKGWVGIRMDDESGRWTLVEIFPESPALRAGLQKGDVLVELEGVPYVEERKEELHGIYMSKGPGDSLEYVIERDGEEKTVRLELARMPNKLLALWLGEKILYSYSEVTGEDLGLYPKKEKKKPETNEKGDG